MTDTARKVVAELAGSYIFFLFGTGGIVAFLATLNTSVPPAGLSPLTLFVIALSFGLGIFIGIILTGHISGGHLNPAVTISLFVAGKFEGRNVIPYIIAQLVGSVLASATVGALFGTSTAQRVLYGATVPSGSVAAAFAAELVMTFFFLWTILTIASRSKDTAVISAVLGIYITMMILLIGSISGGSVNPARSFGPAVLSGILLKAGDSQWIYWIAPILGGILGSLAFKFMNKDKSKIHM